MSCARQRRTTSLLRPSMTGAVSMELDRPSIRLVRNHSQGHREQFNRRGIFYQRECPDPRRLPETQTHDEEAALGAKILCVPT